MQLNELILQVKGWSEKTPQQLLASLREPSIEYVNEERWTLLRIADEVGKENMDPMIAILKNNGLEWAVFQAGGAGMPLGHPEVNRALLDLHDERFTKLALANRRVVSQLDFHGIDADVDLIRKSQDELKLAERKQLLMQSGAVMWNAFVNSVNKWDGTSPEPRL